MINRFTLAAVAAAFALTGCVKHSIDEPVAAKPAPDFSTGPTLVTVTNVPARTADGATLYVTVDGDDAGALTTGESVALRVPAGTHQIGGYARSLIGRVTIPSVKITTTADSEKHVVYTVMKSKPTFTEIADDPKPQPQAAPAPQAPQPQPQPPQISQG